MQSAVIIRFPIMDSTPEPELPNRIRHWRKAKQWSLRELGDRAGIAYGHLSRMERGNAAVGLHWLERLAPVLGCEIADLLNCSDGGLTEQEREVINTLREIPEGARRMVMAMVASQQPYRGTSEAIAMDQSATG